MRDIVGHSNLSPSDISYPSLATKFPRKTRTDQNVSTVLFSFNFWASFSTAKLFI